MRDEQSMFRTVFEQAKAPTSLDGKPLVVLTAAESLQKHEEWFEESFEPSVYAIGPDRSARSRQVTSTRIFDGSGGPGRRARRQRDARAVISPNPDTSHPRGTQ